MGEFARRVRHRVFPSYMLTSHPSSLNDPWPTSRNAVGLRGGNDANPCSRLMGKGDTPAWRVVGFARSPRRNGRRSIGILGGHSDRVKWSGVIGVEEPRIDLGITSYSSEVTKVPLNFIGYDLMRLLRQMSSPRSMLRGTISETPGIGCPTGLRVLLPLFMKSRAT